MSTRLAAVSATPGSLTRLAYRFSMRGRSQFDLPLLFCLIGLLFGLQACEPTLLMSRAQTAAAIARQVNWEPQDFDTKPFLLRLYLPAVRRQNSQVTIYIESDGRSHVNRWATSDPTPVDPIGLRLAAAKNSQASAYIARPCQYTLERDAARCHPAYWTNGRYDERVLTATSQAVDHIKSLFKARQVVLVGYSGGGAVAALLAARRNDVTLLVTVAANLDTEYWVNELKVGHLKGSLNPADFGRQLRRQRQIHFVGEDDKRVSPNVARSYVAKVDPTLIGSIRLIKDADHDCCWEDLWPSLSQGIIP